MSGEKQSDLFASQFKNIDGLQIRFATNDKKSGDSILLLSPLPESILAFLPTWDMFSALGPVLAWISRHLVAPRVILLKGS